MLLHVRSHSVTQLCHYPSSCPHNPALVSCAVEPHTCAPCATLARWCSLVLMRSRASRLHADVPRTSVPQHLASACPWCIALARLLHLTLARPLRLKPARTLRPCTCKMLRAPPTHTLARRVSHCLCPCHSVRYAAMPQPTHQTCLVFVVAISAPMLLPRLDTRPQAKPCSWPS